jgi:hypothetical protein
MSESLSLLNSHRLNLRNIFLRLNYDILILSGYLRPLDWIRIWFDCITFSWFLQGLSIWVNWCYKQLRLSRVILFLDRSLLFSNIVIEVDRFLLSERCALIGLLQSGLLIYVNCFWDSLFDLIWVRWLISVLLLDLFVFLSLNMGDKFLEYLSTLIDWQLGLLLALLYLSFDSL